jgi:hypothetical protein
MHKSSEGILVILTFQAYFYIFSRNKLEYIYLLALFLCFHHKLIKYILSNSWLGIDS